MVLLVWWFENSRACLYYFVESFFDCQSDARPFGVHESGVRGVGVFVRTSFLIGCFVNFVL